MIHRGCVKGFVFPDDGELVAMAPAATHATGNGYFCQTCGKPLSGQQRKYCSNKCIRRSYYRQNKDKWKRYGSKKRAERPADEEVGHVKR